MPGTAGPKIAQMLRKPHFRTCQRFERVSGVGRSYLALWVLQSPDAFKTEQYTTDWGFFEWAPHITDWSRDLFDGGNAAEADFAVPPGGALDVVSFDSMAAGEMNEARAAAAKSHPDMMWLPIIGLDRHTSLMGLRVLPDPSGASQNGRTGIQEAIYRPISNFITAE